MTAVVKRHPRGKTSHIKTGYAEIAEDFRRRIDSGELKHGTPLPKLEDLAVQLRVSRMTAHRALVLLQDELYLRPATHEDNCVRVHLGGPIRKYELLRNMLNDLETGDEKLHIPGNRIPGTSHSLVRNDSTQRWELEQEEQE